jgi:hypothetical protein
VNGATVALARSPTRQEVSMIGQQNAFIAAAAQPGIDVRNGLFYGRDLKTSASGAIGISAVPNTGGAVTLRLEHVTVDSCMGGGILLDGAAFDIRNATVTNNGPGDDGGATWGGMRIKNPAAAGPKQITLTTIRLNNGAGVSCAGPIENTSTVLVVDNVNTVQVTQACGFSSCVAASSTCGAQ